MPYPNLLIILCFVFTTLIPEYAFSRESEFFNNESDLIIENLNNSALGVPIFIRSMEGKKTLKAEVYGKLDYPFKDIQNVLKTPENWCDILTLNLNIKACTFHKKYDPVKLGLYVGRKVYETPEDAQLLNYQYKQIENTPEKLSISLSADEGPMATSNYLIEFYAIPAPTGTYLKVYMSYEPSFFSRIATSTYLTTLGRDKVGFSLEKNSKTGKKSYVKGIKGIIERNAMRYYLATVAFLDTRDLPESYRFSTRSQRWFDLTEQFVKQLHEMERSEYLNTKQLERRNQYVLQARLNANL